MSDDNSDFENSHKLRHSRAKQPGSRPRKRKIVDSVAADLTRAKKAKDARRRTKEHVETLADKVKELEAANHFMTLQLFEAATNIDALTRQSTALQAQLTALQSAAADAPPSDPTTLQRLRQSILTLRKANDLLQTEKEAQDQRYKELGLSARKKNR